MGINFSNQIYKTMIDNFKKSLSYTGVTTQISNSGGKEKLIEATAINIDGAFFMKENVKDPTKTGVFQSADAILLYYDYTLTINSYITYNGVKYQIRELPTKRFLGTTSFYFMARLYKYE